MLVTRSATAHFLVVEDDDNDFALIEQTLRRGGFPFTLARIDNLDELGRAFERQRPDVVLCDHASASWDSLAVLRVVRQREPEMPFVLVTGSIQDEDRERLLGSGADDCVLKDRLEFLSPVVRGALRLGRERLRARALEAECRQLRRELEAAQARRGLQQALPICAGCKQILGGPKGTTKLETYLREKFAIRFSHGLCAECVKQYSVESP